MTRLGPEASALVEAARSGDEPTEGDRERVRAAIATRLLAGTAVGVGAAAAAKLSASTIGAAGGAPVSAVIPAGVATKALITAALVGVIGVGAAVVGRALPRHAPPASAATQPSPAVALDAPASTTESPKGASPSAAASFEPRVVGLHPNARTGPVGAAAPSARNALSAGDVAAEVRLLDEAHAIMRGGDAERALVLLDEHARRFPKGALGEERDAARIAALCALGRVAEARDAADRFLRAAPKSPHAGPIRASCGGSGAVPPPPL